MNGYSRTSTLVVAFAVAILGNACADGTPPSADSSATPQTLVSGVQNLKAGTYAFVPSSFDASGRPFPNVLITVPDGWQSYDGFAVQSLPDTPREMAVSVWDVVDVYGNGCRWVGTKMHPGATVNALASSLASIPLRNATTPVAVSLAGYNGSYIEWSVPAEIQFSNCDQGYFRSWTGQGDRYQQGPGQVDRLWIIDVAGRRLVIDAAYMPGATEADRAALAQVVHSIAFRP